MPVRQLFHLVQTAELGQALLDSGPEGCYRIPVRIGDGSGFIADPVVEKRHFLQIVEGFALTAPEVHFFHQRQHAVGNIAVNGLQCLFGPKHAGSVAVCVGKGRIGPCIPQFFQILDSLRKQRKICPAIVPPAGISLGDSVPDKVNI